MKPPIIFSFFSGVGFLDLGFEKAGYEVAFVNEIHASFLHAYKHSRKIMRIPEPRFGFHEGDISEFFLPEFKARLKDMVKECLLERDVVGFIGGPPCPDFSIGGKNRGREGDNGKLSATFIELICDQKPSFFVFENVKGLWKTRKHRRFYEELKNRLHSNGYVTTERLINALEYGVPQDRERIILIGFKSDFLADIGHKVSKPSPNLDEIFPWKKRLKYPIYEVKAYPWPGTNTFIEDSDIPCPDGIPLELTVEHWFRKNKVLNHPNSSMYFKPRAGRIRMASIDEGDDSKKSYKRLHRWRYSPTAAYGNNEVHLHPYKIRRISVSEALAIQSLPLEFELPDNITLTDAFKTIGNGVPYLASKGVAETLLDFLGVKTCGLQHLTSSEQSTNYQETVTTSI